MQLTAAYAAIASGVVPVQPYGAPDSRPLHPGLALDPRARAGMLDLMHAVVAGGTGQAANLPIGAYGKTGTSQDYRDAWFIGFVGDLVIGVWVGNDDNSPMRGVTGGSLPAQIWREVMDYAIARIGVRVVTPPQAPAPPRPQGPALPFVVAPRPDGETELDAPLILAPPQDQASPAAVPFAETPGAESRGLQ
jgi:penicillin-binding protein 1A